MIASVLSPVHILSYEDMDASLLYSILGYVANKMDNLSIALVTDNAPIPKKTALIEELSKLCSLSVFDQVQPNPRCEDIMAMFNNPSFAGSDVIIAIGGGSVLDSAKALAMLSTNKGNLTEYLGNQPKRKITEKNLPLVLIPTTAGTGSEVTKVGVYTDETGRKYTLGSPLMSAHTAILISSMLDGLPPSLCAATGLDALDHALESIWNKNSNPVTRSVARQAAIDVLEQLPLLYRAILNKQQNRRPLQKSMFEASCAAGIAFNMTGTAAGHAISFILSEEWHVPHGLACAFTLLEVYDWACTAESNKAELALISKHFHPNLETEESLVAQLRQDIKDLTEELQLPKSFSSIGVQLSLEQLDSLFARSFDDPKLHNQTPPLSTETLHTILEKKL